MPWSRKLSFSDPYECQIAIPAADIEIIPTAKGAFRLGITQVGMPNLWMQRFQMTSPHVSTASLSSDRYAIGFLADETSSSFRYCGRELSPNAIVTIGDEVAYQNCHVDSVFGTMSLRKADLRAAAQSLTGGAFDKPLRGTSLREVPGAISRARSLHRTVAELASHSPDILAQPAVQHAFEQKMVHAMVRCLTDETSAPAELRSHYREKMMRRFRDCLEANPLRPLYLVEICSAIGVAERTLRLACEEHLGMGPIRFLTQRRMHLVRRALLSAVDPKTTVTGIIIDHGFWEFGRFSVAYKALFGESPSATLRTTLRSQRDGTSKTK